MQYTPNTSWRKIPVRLIVWLIRAYQRTLSLDQPSILSGIVHSKKRICVFYPTCSEYAKEAFLKHGFLKGIVYTIRRIGRCHPWQREHIDLVP